MRSNDNLRNAKTLQTEDFIVDVKHVHSKHGTHYAKLQLTFWGTLLASVFEKENGSLLFSDSLATGIQSDSIKDTEFSGFEFVEWWIKDKV